MKKIFIVVAAFGGIGSAACSGTVQLSTVDDVCSKRNGDIVAVDGYLFPPNFLGTTTIDAATGQTTYELSLVSDRDGTGRSITTAIEGTQAAEANRIAELSPEGYTQKDVRIFTDAGETVGSLDRLRITGELSKVQDSREGNPCRLRIEKIERPDLP